MSNDPSNTRKRAKKRGLTMKFGAGLYSFYDAGTLVFQGHEIEAKKFLAGIGAPRGRPKGWSPPPKKLGAAALGITLADYNRARHVGDYQMRVRDGVITLRLGDDNGELILETADVERFRRFLKNAAERLVPRGPKAVEREAKSDAKLKATLLASAEREARGIARRARLKAERASRKAEGHLRGDDPGLASEDFTPANAQGLLETEVELPAWLSADAALIALWRAEWRCAGRASPVIREGLKAARRALAEPTEVRLLVLSDGDRASLARYRAPANVVFVAAALAPRLARQGRERPGLA